MADKIISRVEDEECHQIGDGQLPRLEDYHQTD